MTSFEQTQATSYCVLVCRGESFAFPASAVRNVTPACELSPLPVSHSGLAGLTYMHKEFVPVFDLQSWIQPGQIFPENGQQTIFLNSDFGPWGILIDQVLGLESIEVSFNGTRNSETRSETPGWPGVNIGSATFQERFVSVLDADLLFGLVNDHLRNHWQSMDESTSLEDTSSLDGSPTHEAATC